MLKSMSEYPWWSQQDSNQKGPFPLVASLNGELLHSGIERTYHDTLLKRGVGAKALLPLVLEISVPALRGSDIPVQFAKAHDAVYAPVSDEFIEMTGKANHNLDGGTVCILPEPINLGISALVMWQKRHSQWGRPDLDWHIDTLDLLASDQSDHLGIVDAPYRRIPWLGRIIDEIPTLTKDAAVQREFESALRHRQETVPESLDEVITLTPGVMEVYIRDGLTMDTHEYLTCYDFVRAAKHTSPSNPGYGKGLFAAIAHHIANEQLASIRRTNPEEAKRVANHIGNIRQSLYWVTATNLSPTNPSRQLGLDYEEVHETAQQIMSGELKVKDIGKKGIELLGAMFDPTSE